MILERVVGEYISSQGYLIGSEGKGIIIDTPMRSYARFIELAKQHELEIEGIYLTHTHLDHLADAKPLKEYFQCPIFVHSLDRGNLEVPGSDGVEKYLGSDGSKMYGIEATEADHLLHDGEECQVGKIRFQVMHTPGHTPGSVSFYFPKEGVVFTGDVLMRGTHGRTDFPTSNQQEIQKSLEKLAKLPESVIVYAGHLNKTTIGKEKEWICRL